jgi:hypothetical protein
MTVDLQEKTQAFQFLDNTGALSDKEIEECFNEDVLPLVRILVSEFTEGRDLTDQLTQSEFVRLMRELRRTKRMWGRRLGDAIILSGDKADTGDYASAIVILQEFIKDCPSRYFREHAQNRMRYYKETQEQTTG